MPYYYKSVCYVDYYENSNKCCNIGHVKWLVREDLCTITIQLRSRYCKNDQTAVMSILTGDRNSGYKNLPIANLTFQNNMVLKTLEYPVKSIAGIPLDQVVGIHIAFPTGNYAVALFQGNESISLTEQKEEPKPSPIRMEPEMTLDVEEDTIPAEINTDISKESTDIDTSEESSEDPAVELHDDASQQTSDYVYYQDKLVPIGVLTHGTQKTDTDVSSEIEGESTEATPESPLVMTKEQDIRINCSQLSADKWQQLCTMYPVLHPLKNEKDFLSISPKDFVIFSKEFQKLVHNSFLLHGFYNYRHLILGKYEENYYLGVPGTYHEREALVAEMFGFTNFESVDQKETGAFGYYMIKVNL